MFLADVPLVQEPPQIVYGGMPDNGQIVPLYTMDSIDKFVTGKQWQSQGDIPPEFAVLTHPMTDNVHGFHGLNGLVGMGCPCSATMGVSGLAAGYATVQPHKPPPPQQAQPVLTVTPPASALSPAFVT